LKLTFEARTTNYNSDQNQSNVTKSWSHQWPKGIICYQMLSNV